MSAVSAVGELLARMCACVRVRACVCVAGAVYCEMYAGNPDGLHTRHDVPVDASHQLNMARS
jgi:hypothetical protein